MTSAFRDLGLLALLSLLLVPVVAEAQTLANWDPQGLQVGRTELEALLENLDGVVGSTAYSGRVREDARRDAELVRERLTLGDFRIGDQITLYVEGEPNLTGDFPVEGGPQINLIGLGPITLIGVLRSEIEPYLTREIGRFITNPALRATSRIRVSVQGAVGAPGFYHAPAEMLLSDVIMMAGGPSGNANLEDMRIDRVGQPIWEGDEVRLVLAEGRTLDQMNLRGGDEVVIPVNSDSIWGSVLRWTLGVAVSVAFGIGLF